MSPSLSATVSLLPFIPLKALDSKWCRVGTPQAVTIAPISKGLVFTEPNLG